MTLALRPATKDQRAFCEALTRSHLAAYRAARDMSWDAGLYRASWQEFENLMILADERVAGVLRLRAAGAALEIRDLQVVPELQGQRIGTWAIQQAKALAAGRGFDMVRLRVFAENPARSLYARLGFVSEAIVAGKVHMAFDVRPGTPGVVAPAAMTWEQRA